MESVIGGWYIRKVSQSRWEIEKRKIWSPNSSGTKNQHQNLIDWETLYITIFNSFFFWKALKTMSDEPRMRYFQVNPKNRWTLNLHIAGGKIKLNLRIVVTIQLRWFKIFRTRFAKWRMKKKRRRNKSERIPVSFNESTWLECNIR